MRRRKSSSTISFDRTDFVEKELIDKFLLWMLRTIVKCGGHKEFIDKNNYFRDDEVACFLGLEKYVDMDDEEFKRGDVIDILKSNLQKLEKRVRFTSSKTLAKNIKQISKLMNLNHNEEKVLEFFICLDQHNILESVTDYIGSDLNTSQVYKTISIVLNIPAKEIKAIFSSNSRFSKSMILTIDKGKTFSLERKIEFLSSEFVDNMMNLDENISAMIQDSVRL